MSWKTPAERYQSLASRKPAAVQESNEDYDDDLDNVEGWHAHVVHQTNQCRLDHTNRIGVRCWPRSGRSIHLDRVMVVMVVTVVLYYSVRRRDGRAHRHRPNQRERSMRLRMSSARQTVVLLPSLMPWGNLPSRIPAHQAERLMGIRDRICGNRTKPVSGSAGRGWYMASIRGRLGMLCIECHKNRHS